MPSLLTTGGSAIVYDRELVYTYNRISHFLSEPTPKKKKNHFIYLSPIVLLLGN